MKANRIADLFCGAGGAGMGLHRAGLDVVGFDINPQPHYPFEFHQQDALTVDLSGFDAVWASPPCQAYIQRNKNLDTKHPKLIEPTIEYLEVSGKPYIIENVLGQPLEASLMLCGTMFGLKVLRHRYFRTSFPAPLAPASCSHVGSVSTGEYAAVYAYGGKGPRHVIDGRRVREASPTSDGPEWDDAMDIDWMNKYELSQAIPPAYSEFIGRQLLQHMGVPAPAPPPAAW